MDNNLRKGEWFSLLITAEGHRVWAYQTPEFDADYERHFQAGEEIPGFAVVRILTDDGPFKAGQEIVCSVLESQEDVMELCNADLIRFATPDEILNYSDACMHTKQRLALKEFDEQDGWGDEGLGEAEAAFYRDMERQSDLADKHLERELEIDVNRHFDGIHQIDDEDLPKVYGGQQ